MILGLLVAGGASQRFGRDKATTPLLAGVAPSRDPFPVPTLAAYARARLEAAGLQVVVAARGRRLFPELPAVDDGPGGGPAAGLLGAAEAYPETSFVALACDLPAVPSALLAWLGRRQADLALPSWHDAEGAERLEPLCALYRPAALTVMRARALAGRFDLHGLADISGLRVERVGPELLSAFGTPAKLFLNVNRPADLLTFAGAYAALRHTLPDSRGER
jgi:molybdopterin-guanine dinucleotide biosynthesis protein A